MPRERGFARYGDAANRYTWHDYTLTEYFQSLQAVSTKQRHDYLYGQFTSKENEMTITVRVTHETPGATHHILVEQTNSNMPVYLGPGESKLVTIHGENSFKVSEAELPEHHPAVPRKSDADLIQMVRKMRDQVCGVNTANPEPLTLQLDTLLVHLNKPVPDSVKHITEMREMREKGRIFSGDPVSRI